MRPLTPDERWALDVLVGPPRRYDARDGMDGTRLDGQILSLIERGLIVWRRDERSTGIDIGVSDLGRLAWRVSRVVAEQETT